MPDATFVFDRTGAVVFGNQLGLDLFGLEREDLEGMRIIEVAPIEFHEGFDERNEAFFRNPGDRSPQADVGLIGRRSDGSEFALELKLSKVEVAGSELGVVAFRDVSTRVDVAQNRKQMEAELELNRTRRLESVGELASGIAHDFNNLIGVIINYSDFVREAVGDDPQMKADLKQIRTAGERAAQLTSQLLTFSRREVVRPIAISLDEVLSDLESLLRHALGERIRIKADHAPDLSTVMADPSQIEQVVLNLALNARAAMPDGGTLEITAENVDLDRSYMLDHPGLPAPGKYVRLTVSDDGEGMDRATLDRAFEPFFTTKDRTQGTGLGLASAYGIVTRANGHIFIESRLGEGTSVTIHLPAVEMPATAARVGRGEVTGGSGQRVLVVEDEDSIRRMVVRILEANGYRTVSFPDGTDALHLLEDPEEEFDLLITDVMMPEMLGTELFERAAQVRPQLPVLFMSGYNDHLIDGSGQNNPFDNLLEKPFAAVELLEQVSQVLE